MNSHVLKTCMVHTTFSKQENEMAGKVPHYRRGVVLLHLLRYAVIRPLPPHFLPAFHHSQIPQFIPFPNPCVPPEILLIRSHWSLLPKSRTIFDADFSISRTRIWRGNLVIFSRPGVPLAGPAPSPAPGSPVNPAVLSFWAAPESRPPFGVLFKIFQLRRPPL